jgi:hypothetical protein
LEQQAGLSDTFDSYVDAALRRFQLRHGLIPDGVMGEGTIEALNVPAHVRLRQLETNLVRVRSMSGNLGDRYVMVNIPAAEIEAVENGRVRSRHTAVVGKIDRQTPILNSKIYELNFNPYWTVPVSIIRKDLIPKMKEDPEYLARRTRSASSTGKQRTDLAADRLEHGRGDPVPLHPGSGRGKFARLRADQLPQQAPGLSARHAVQDPVRWITGSIPPAASAFRTCANW